MLSSLISYVFTCSLWNRYVIFVYYTAYRDKQTRLHDVALIFHSTDLWQSFSKSYPFAAYTHLHYIRLGLALLSIVMQVVAQATLDPVPVWIPSIRSLNSKLSIWHEDGDEVQWWR